MARNVLQERIEFRSTRERESEPGPAWANGSAALAQQAQGNQIRRGSHGLSLQVRVNCRKERPVTELCNKRGRGQGNSALTSGQASGISGSLARPECIPWTGHG